jgi:hypothetical protein
LGWQQERNRPPSNLDKAREGDPVELPHGSWERKSTQPYTVTVDGETGLRAPRELYGGAETALTHIVFKLPMQFKEELFESYRREWGKKHPRRATANPGASGGCRKTKQYKHAIGDL